ncbi:short-chain fatty acyl-CoA regulator family protein [Dietzia sp. 179-F 9C3 NHS]|uniref:short-chain fatty acyl-CoA regulator family protein n=1 Tax=Dietzia sp. 179-F 9C3 NHS TaxID=3374295 RepID=UPI00387A6864
MAKHFAGARIRRLRAEIGVSQVELARRLDLSTSYLNQLENDQRPLTVPVLLRLTSTFDLDAGFFSDDAEARLVADVRAALADGGARIDAGTDESAVAAELVARFPDIARHLVALTGRLDGAAAEPADGGVDGQRAYEGVRDFFYRRRNHIAELDAAAEELAARFPEVGAAVEPELLRWMREELGVRVETVPVDEPGEGHEGDRDRPSIGVGFRRRYDRERRCLSLPADASAGRRCFQMGIQIAFLRHADLVDRIVASETGLDEATRALVRVGLAQYFAGALVLPYGRFLDEARRRRYDVELLAQRFGVGFETVCHRLSTLQRRGARGVPFLFLRTDRAGNISKRQSATAFHFSRSGGSCPLWVVHRAFESPRRVVRQVAEMPDGRRYLWIARTVTGRSHGFGAPTPEFAVALGCAIEHADQLVYSRGLDLSDRAAATPIGAGCRVCDRRDCLQRAFPRSGRDVIPPEDGQGASPYASA